MTPSVLAALTMNLIDGIKLGIPDLSKAYGYLYQAKQKRKLRKDLNINAGEGAEDNTELDWDVTANTEQAI